MSVGIAAPPGRGAAARRPGLAEAARWRGRASVPGGDNSSLGEGPPTAGWPSGYGSGPPGRLRASRSAIGTRGTQGPGWIGLLHATCPRPAAAGGGSGSRSPGRTRDPTAARSRGWRLLWAASISSTMRRLSGKRKAEPDGVADDLRREPVAGVGELGPRHARPVAGSPPARNLPRANLTVSDRDRLTDEAAVAGGRHQRRAQHAGRRIRVHRSFH
jgi:hypothetical protein